MSDCLKCKWLGGAETFKGSSVLFIKCKWAGENKVSRLARTRMEESEWWEEGGGWEGIEYLKDCETYEGKG